MPYMRSGTPSEGSSSASEQGPQHTPTQAIIDDEAYAEVLKNVFPDYAEAALSEQLEPIAVVGMGCRLPGDVKSPDEFWRMMLNKGTGQMDKVPSSRFNIDAHFHENNDRPGSFAVKGGYFLHENLTEFDPTFFGVTPIEAMWMDPQQRKLLEVVYETFESAGATLPNLAGSQTAVFVASFTADFQQMAFKESSFRHSLAATGVDPGIISNRISHVFNLKGPSIVVNTACSSSVYALHNACNALRNQECSAAVVGGVNLVLTVDQHMNTAKLGVLSPTSTCHTFDASADGYGRAEGVGAVYLKRLRDAIACGDPVRGVIRSSATNNNGKVQGVGITHPNREGQEHVIRHAYHRGGELDPRLTGLFEIHGTGTAVGDPLEVHAVASAMDKIKGHSDPNGPLTLGAVKTNIGHSEAASGLSALIKAILSVERGIIPPTRGVTNPSPAIDWEGWHVAVAHKPAPFPPTLPVKRVSVNSFGYGGTNAHIFVESTDSLLTLPQTYRYHGSPRSKQLARSRGTIRRNRPFLLQFSAHDNATLRRNIKAIGQVAGEYQLLDLAYTLGNRRTNFDSRGMVVTSAASVSTTLQEEDLSAFKFLDRKSSKKPTLGFVFTGQGAQWARMGAELMTYYPSFLRTIRHLDLVLGDLEDAPEWTIEDLLQEPAEISCVNEAEFSQPLCTAIQIATVNLLHFWNVIPKVTVGHSSGEIAAAYAAGLVTASEAIVAAYYRGKVVRDVHTNGAMMAVGLGAEAVEPFLQGLEGRIVIACHNSPGGVTLSGDADAIEAVQQKLEAQGTFARIVKTNGKAYHSHHMEPVSQRYQALMRHARENDIMVTQRIQSGAVMVSSVTNEALPANAKVQEEYWSSNLLSPVLFNQAVQTLTREYPDVDLLIEIGPHSAMSGSIRQIKTFMQRSDLNYLPSLIRNADSAVALLTLCGELFLRGHDLDMARVTAIEESSSSTGAGKVWLTSGNFIVDLPPYQWDRTKSYFAESRMSKEHRAPTHMRHDILGSLIFGASKAELTWRNVLRLRDLVWLKDHSLGGEAVFPAAGYFSMAMEALTQLNETSSSPVPIQCFTLRDISIKNALVTPDDDNGIEVLFNLRPSLHAATYNGQPWWDFNVSSVDADGLTKDHMAGSIALNARSARPTPKQVPSYPQRASGKAWNQALRRVGFDYGPTFQDMEDIRFDGVSYAAASKTTLKTTVDGVAGESRHALHPACVDSCLQLLIVAIYAGRTSSMPCGAVPIQVDEISIWAPTALQMADPVGRAFSWIDQRGVRSFVGSNQLVASDGQVVMEITDMRCKLYEAAVPQRLAEVSRPKPRTYGEMVWKQDVEEVLSDNNPLTISVTELVELLEFKHPGQNTADLTGQYAEELRALLPDLSVVLPEQKTKEGREEDKTPVLKESSFDIIISDTTTSETTEDVRRLLVDGGRVIFVTEPSSDISDSLLELGLTDVRYSSGGFVTAVLPPKGQGEGEREINGAKTSGVVQVIYRDGPSPAVSLRPIKDALEAHGYAVRVSRIDEADISVSENIIMLADEERPLLVDIDPSEFAGLQNVINQAKKILWVTAGSLLRGSRPEYYMSSGLARSLRSEQAALKITTLDVDDAGRVDIISQKAISLFQDQVQEREYCLSDGQVYISRLLFDDQLNRTYATDETDLQEKPFDPTVPLIGKVQSGHVVFQADARIDEALGEDEVEVQVRVSGLNKEDTLVINGTDYPTDFSHEIGGVITRVGSGVSRLMPGDFVAGYSFDKLATFQRTPHTLLCKVDSEEDMLAVAGLPMAFGAALYGLQTQAALQSGESVLILPGAGLAGNAAIQVTQLLGGRPIVGLEDEARLDIDTVAAHYGLPREQVLPISSIEKSRCTSSTLMGFDIIFSSGWVHPTIAREAWRHLAPFGRFIDCGRKNVLSRTILDTIPIHRGASYMAFDMLDLCQHRPQTLMRLMKRIVQLYQSKQISPLQPQTRINIAGINAAVSDFSDNYTAGKTLLVYETGITPLQISPSIPSIQLQPDVTYFLVGCLGGLGRSLTSWMMKKGAKNFTFLSRSGADSTEAATLVEHLQTAGANVQVIRGDVSVREDVERAVKGVDPSVPIRGVIHAAMVLRDGLFHNMPYDSWTASIKPKVAGARNLHLALAHEKLDFFIMTSSISGTLGTPAQSNYAAGNAYMDILARHRHAQGLPATSIVLPMVLGVGVVAENLELEASLKRKGMYGVDEESLLAAFDVAMQEQAKPGAMGCISAIDHLVAGMDPALLAAAIDEAGEGDDVDSFWTADPRFRTVVSAMRSSGGRDSGTGTVLGALKSGELVGGEARSTISEHMAGKLCRMLMLDAADVRVDEGSISSYGVDSMIGAELRTWIFKEFDADVPFQQLLGATLTINKFAEIACIVIRPSTTVLLQPNVTSYVGNSEYHVAFLLLYEVLMFPTRKEATRIWRCLDVIFAEPLAKMPPPPPPEHSKGPDMDTSTFSKVIQELKVKGRYILSLIYHELRVYRARKSSGGRLASRSR
ncbi:type I polyketide synthase [Aspergillus stella-maris]|uniref:type I polyketide synthase n=1 Tax=Aspergillus stella-maris TaxID=1810926 RepID=UPI003CCCAF02